MKPFHTNRSESTHCIVRSLNISPRDCLLFFFIAAHALQKSRSLSGLTRIHFVELAAQVEWYLELHRVPIVAQPALDFAKAKLAQAVHRQGYAHLRALDSRRASLHLGQQLRVRQTPILGEPRLREVNRLPVYDVPDKQQSVL